MNNDWGPAEPAIEIWKNEADEAAKDKENKSRERSHCSFLTMRCLP